MTPYKPLKHCWARKRGANSAHILQECVVGYATSAPLVGIPCHEANRSQTSIVSRSYIDKLTIRCTLPADLSVQICAESDASKSELKSIENRSYSKLPGVDDSGSASVNFMINVEGIGEVLNRWFERFRLGIA